MSKKNKTQPAASLTPSVEAKPSPPGAFRMRLQAGQYAVAAVEAEVRAMDGGRIAGGNGVFEFDLFAETWVDIHIVRS